MNNEPNDETRPTSSRILPNSQLYVRPSTCWLELKVCVQRSKVCPGASEQGRLFCMVRSCVLASCAWQMCLTWCVGCLWIVFKWLNICIQKSLCFVNVLFALYWFMQYSSVFAFVFLFSEVDQIFKLAIRMGLLLLKAFNSDKVNICSIK